MKSIKAKGKNVKEKIIGVIPARFSSTRFPGKPLADINGKPMIQHVYENCLGSKLLEDLIVATDDKRILKAVAGFGGNAVMTSGKHKSGTDRIGEVAKLRNLDIGSSGIIVNIQGDEPFINHANIDKAIKPLLGDKSLNVSTLCIRIKSIAEINDPNIVKVVFDNDGFAIYFSRSAIPFNRDKSKNVNYYKHIGLYVYRKSFLDKLVKMKPAKLELTEKLEQLRMLESGERIKVIETNIDSHSVDTKADLRKLKRLNH